MKFTLLFLVCFIEESVILKYEKLLSELAKEYHLYWTSYIDGGINYHSLLNWNINIFLFSEDQLNRLNYPPVYEQLYESEYFIMEYFLYQHSKYEYYWGIECNVIFIEDGNILFSTVKNCNADIIGSYIEGMYKDGVDSRWNWWNVISFAEKDKVGKEKLIKSLNPIYRISSRILCFLDEDLQKNKNDNFYELTMATLLCHYGFKPYRIKRKISKSLFRNIRRESIYTQRDNEVEPKLLYRKNRALETKNKLFHLP